MLVADDAFSNAVHVASVVSLAFAALLCAGIGSAAYTAVGLDKANSVDGGNVQGIAKLIFDESRKLGLDVVAVRVWETPTSRTEYAHGD